MRRGLMLVEVVAATALLALIVLACVPLLRSARADLAAAQSEAQVEGGELEAAVDALLRQRPRLAQDVLEQRNGVQARWLADGREYAARIRLARLVRVEPEDRRSSHAWLTFAFGQVELVRWVRTPYDTIETDT